MITFFVPCVPPKTSHHAKRIVRRGAHFGLADTDRLNDAKDLLAALFVPFRPATPYTGPLVLEIDLTWPWLKSDSKRVRSREQIPHDTKPDWDNAAKGICDCLAKLRFLEQDSQIVDGRVRKWRGDEPGIEILLYPWEAS
jgi:Holliday junction resolvase RusA-like endonuclease